MKEDIRVLILVMLWDIRKLGRYKFFLAMRFTWFLVQVLVFGLLVSAMVSIRGPGGLLDYYKFYIIGAYTAVLFSISIMKGYDIAEEIEDGLIDYQLSLPIKRRVLALGRALGGGLASFTYSTPMLAVTILALKVQNPIALLAMTLVSLLLAVSVSGLAVSIALILKSGDRLDILMGVSDALLIRLSTIFYPAVAMAAVSLYYYAAKVNPISYAADMLRYVAEPGEFSGFLVADPLIMFSLIAGFAATSTIASIVLLERKIEGGYSR
ncbi:MAG: ABC transporter permease [Thermoprotei archaeon]|nr:ABC transporter permease [Thermoprotei archaeon]